MRFLAGFWRSAFLSFVCLVVAVPGYGRVLFSDGFESGDRLAQQGGFAWKDSGRNVYIDRDPETGRRVPAFRGHDALGFTYRGKPDGKDSTAQQNFNLGEPKRNLWIRYFVRIPTNFVHRRQQFGSTNNKWLALWSDQYRGAGEGILIVWEYWPSRSVPGGSEIAYHFVHQGKPSSHLGRTQFIGPEMRGQWIEFVHHVRFPRGPNTDDAVIQMWMRPVGTREYTVLHDAHDVPARYTGGPLGFTKGYLFGWANSGFSQDTTFVVDDFEVSDSPPSSSGL